MQALRVVVPLGTHCSRHGGAASAR